ncbi:MarR family EPS-associated transcriptional regulator [Candidatus Omnitrophota bacterium]
MNEQTSKEDNLKLIKEIENSSETTQRTLSAKLGISLGKTNYLLKEVVTRGWITVRNFSHEGGKLKKVQYTLTKKGLEGRMHLTYHFLKRKETEYNRIKKEWELLSENSKQKTVDIKPITDNQKKGANK